MREVKAMKPKDRSSIHVCEYRWFANISVQGDLEREKSAFFGLEFLRYYTLIKNA